MDKDLSWQLIPGKYEEPAIIFPKAGHLIQGCSKMTDWSCTLSSLNCFPEWHIS